MIIFPCCKINLGLNVISRRSDGYHDIETVFYPIPLHDALDVTLMDKEYPSDVQCDLLTKVVNDGTQTTEMLCPEQDNLVVKAYNIVSKDYQLPRVHAHLIKYIPSQAGMGGGSSDAAAMIRLLNKMFNLGMTTEKMQQYAAQLGADCAFFITEEPAYATGIGEILSPIRGGIPQLSGNYIALVKPDVAVSTGKAYGMITPQKPELCCRDVLNLPISEWRDKLTNDFEGPVFKMHPELGAIKDKLYDMGAEFAMMSGSGSTLFGLFREEPQGLNNIFPDCFTKMVRLYSSNSSLLTSNFMTDNKAEIFPVTDADGRILGKITRGEAHSGTRVLHPVVHLHVFNSRGEIYLQQRPLWKDIQPGKWDTAVGGHVDFSECLDENGQQKTELGDSVVKALRREVREELGITDFEPIAMGHYVFEGLRERELVYVHRTVYDGAIAPSKEELAGGKFWTKEELLSNIGKGIFTPNFEDEYQRLFM